MIHLAWLFAAPPAPASPPPLPSYRDHLARQRWRETDALLSAGCAFDRFQGGVVCADGVTAAVIASVDTFQAAVLEDAALQYLAGLASRYAGDPSAARRRYVRALELDPTLVEAWYDLGELHLASGRFEDARAAFEEVDRLPNHRDTPWLAPWRLAEVAAHLGEAEAFERNLDRALRSGFSFRQVEGLPNWRAFYADPVIGPRLRVFLTVYADPSIERSLTQPLPVP